MRAPSALPARPGTGRPTPVWFNGPAAARAGARRGQPGRREGRWRQCQLVTLSASATCARSAARSGVISEPAKVVFSVLVADPEDLVAGATSRLVGTTRRRRRPPDVRGFAEQAHAALGDRARESVLILVAPNARRVEIVMGSELRGRLSDRDCALAALSMTSSFSGGDLAGGILQGVRMLGQRTGKPRRQASVVAPGRSSRSCSSLSTRAPRTTRPGRSTSYEVPHPGSRVWGGLGRVSRRRRPLPAAQCAGDAVLALEQHPAQCRRHVGGLGEVAVGPVERRLLDQPAGVEPLDDVARDLVRCGSSRRRPGTRSTARRTAAAARAARAGRSRR